MIENVVKEELIKNQVLDIYSNKFSNIIFDEFKSEKSIPLQVDTSNRYGYLMLEIGDTQNFEVYQNDILLVQAESSVQKFLPILFQKNDILTLKGDAVSVKLILYGAEFLQVEFPYIIPNLNYLIKDRGEYQLLQYENIDNLKANECDLLLSYSQLYHSQIYKIDDELIHGNLYQNENVYFCNSKNNYTDKILITSSLKSAIIVPNISNNSVIFVYVRDSVIYYKELKDDTLSEETEINFLIKKVPKKLLPCMIEEFGLEIFGIEWDDNTISLIDVNNYDFKILYTTKSQNSQIYQNENIIVLISANGYKISINKYEIDTSTSVKTIQKTFTKTINNVIHCLKIDDDYLFQSIDARFVKNESEL